MSDSERPPDSGNAGSEPPAPQRSRRRRLEGVIPEIVKRAVEIGIDTARESPETLKQLVGDRKLPKEIAQYLLGQIDETKNGLFRVVAKEMRDFLEHTNFAGEMQKLLTTVQFEVNTTIRFTPNDGKKKKKARASGKDEAEGQDQDVDEDADLDGRESGSGSGSGSQSERQDEDESDPDVSAAEDDRAHLPRPEVTTAVHVERRRRPKTS